MTTWRQHEEGGGSLDALAGLSDPPTGQLCPPCPQYWAQGTCDQLGIVSADGLSASPVKASEGATRPKPLAVPSVSQAPSFLAWPGIEAQH